MRMFKGFCRFSFWKDGRFDGLQFGSLQGGVYVCLLIMADQHRSSYSRVQPGTARYSQLQSDIARYSAEKTHDVLYLLKVCD